MVNTPYTNHGNTLPTLIGHLHLYPTFDPHSGRLHPEVEGGLVNVNDIGGLLGHQSPGDSRGELLLLV